MLGNSHERFQTTLKVHRSPGHNFRSIAFLPSGLKSFSTLFRHANPQNQQKRSLLLKAASVQNLAQPKDDRKVQPTLKNSSEAFLANESYRDLGFSPVLQSAMQTAGFPQPSAVQALASGPLLAGKNVVLAAETGSGKTLAYLLPILQAILKTKESGGRIGNVGALVLCPNTALCNQVINVADKLQGPDGNQLVSSVRISSANAPPKILPDIIVSTPSGLINAAREFKDSFGFAWSQAGIVKRAKWVVVDEADLLMTGGYARDLKKILSSMRTADVLAKSEQISENLGLGFEQFQALPRLEKVEAVSGDLRRIHKLLQEGSPQKEVSTVNGDGNEFSEFWDNLSKPADSTAKNSGKIFNISQQRTSADGSPQSDPEQMVFRDLRQYIFVAATMPQDGKKSVGSEINKVCPDAIWLSGRQLHQSVERISHNWIEVNESTWTSALQETVKASPHGKTLVFAKSVEEAENVAEILREASISPLVYHRELSQEDKENVLSNAAQREDIVIVSTDAAARGIDIPDISHVVQANFASSAIDFLHRVGRTARAGKAGKVTSLYDAGSKILAEAIHGAIEEGQLLEGAFSRNRSFRNKVKKYGRYVPRNELPL